MNIGIIQFAPLLDSPDQTLEKLDHLLDQSAGADLVVLPELANSGYNFQSREQAFRLAEPLHDSRFIRFLEEKAKRNSFFIISGFNEREGNHIFSSSVLIGSLGVIGLYRKIHLFLNEKDFFSVGNTGLPVFDIRMCRIGMLVCFDWIFPEVWRILALKGADLIGHPCNIVLPFAQGVIPSHALVNRVFIALANRTGSENGLIFTGQSVLVSPLGERLIVGSEQKEQVLLFEIDPLQARNKQITPRNHILGDRIPDAYKELMG